MLGELDPQAIDLVLRSEVVGRIGIQGPDRIYVVPITYVYDGDSVYLHSAEGLKLTLMRAHPDVCFEVDAVNDLANWRSVIAWGRFEELTGDLAKAAINLLSARLGPLAASETVGAAGHTPSGAPGTAYRIKLTERTGRFEKPANRIGV